MAAPLGRLALIPLLLIPACHQPVSSTQAGPVPFAVNQQQVVDNTTLEISRSALEYNIHKVQQLLADKTRMCAILKGDAYGHDLSLVTPVMMQNGVASPAMRRLEPFASQAIHHSSCAFATRRKKRCARQRTSIPKS